MAGYSATPWMATNLLGLKSVSEPDMGVVKLPSYNEGISQLQNELLTGRRVIVGVYYGRNKAYNHNKATQHFVAVVGYGVDESGEPYFQYWSPGSMFESRGANPANRFYFHTNARLWWGWSPARVYRYYISEVR